MSFFPLKNQLPSIFLEKIKNPAELVMINTALGQLCLCWSVGGADVGFFLKLFWGIELI